MVSYKRSQPDPSSTIRVLPDQARRTNVCKIFSKDRFSLAPFRKHLLEYQARAAVSVFSTQCSSERMLCLQVKNDLYNS